MERSWGAAERTTLLIVCVGQFLTQMDLTVVNVAMENIRSGLGTSMAYVAWVLDAYFVAFAAFMLVFGDLGDRRGRRAVFSGGLLAFAVTSAICGLAPSASFLIAARAAQGMAGAAVLVSSLSLLSHAFPQRQKRAKAIGLWTSVSGIALVTGPLIGGALVSWSGWRAIFLVNIPIALAGAALSRLRLTESTNPLPGAADLGGGALVVVALAATSISLSLGPRLGWTSPWVLGGTGVALCGAAALLWVERSHQSPLLPLPVLSGRPLLAANGAAFLVNFATLALVFLASAYFEEVNHLGALQTGERLSPMFVAYAVASVPSGKIAARLGPRAPAAVGLLVAALSTAGFRALAAGGGRVPMGYLEVAPVLMAIGAGVGLSLPAVVAAAVGAVPGHRAGLASGLNNTSRQVGGTLGVALAGGLLAATGPEAGAGAALGVVALAYVAGAAVMAFAYRPATAMAERPANGAVIDLAERSPGQVMSAIDA